MTWPFAPTLPGHRQRSIRSIGAAWCCGVLMAKHGRQRRCGNGLCPEAYPILRARKGSQSVVCQAWWTTTSRWKRRTSAGCLRSIAACRSTRVTTSAAASTQSSSAGSRSTSACVTTCVHACPIVAAWMMHSRWIRSRCRPHWHCRRATSRRVRWLRNGLSCRRPTAYRPRSSCSAAHRLPTRWNPSRCRASRLTTSSSARTAASVSTTRAASSS